jgi:hypothetical protein
VTALASLVRLVVCHLGDTGEEVFIGVPVNQHESTSIGGTGTDHLSDSRPSSPTNPGSIFPLFRNSN